MIVSITKIELHSYSKLTAFLKLNRQIIEELKKSNCKLYKVTGSWNLKDWYTMTLWEDANAMDHFYRNGTHLEAMKQAKQFSSNIKATRINNANLIPWKEAKKLFVTT
jgi:hypothetical protein